MGAEDGVNEVWVDGVYELALGGCVDGVGRILLKSYAEMVPCE